jgi:dTDP-4-amino-4,6-dideoxy-D-galactose acyltransferase
MKIDADSWMTTVFGYDVFRVAPEGIDTAVVRQHQRAREGRRAFYYAKVPTARVDQVQALASLGFGVVDVNVTFERLPGDDVDQPTVVVRDATPKDRDALLDIAENCFVYSRFHLDPQVPNRIANAVKREWVDSYLHGRRGEKVRVAEDVGRPVGFLAVLAAKCHGKDARVIDLVGVAGDCQGRGVGKSLVSAFVRERAPGCALLRVGTQAANIPSMRLYERCGFRVAETTYVLHAHVNEPAAQAKDLESLACAAGS